MAAYVIAQGDVRDAERYADYRTMVPASVEKYGGKFIARGGNAEVLEGEKQLPGRLVIIEFESMERAKQWWASEEYRDAKALRQATSNGTLFLVDGT
ncbi:MAG: DUF1330 domain-containing protein [Thermomicrobia bacterium]|nr:DUF1330 domain-containing protein [Thermomicrobia bacterium]